MRLVIVGDVGGADGGFHAGDEAMLEALLDELSERGMTDATIVSSNPEESRARYGRTYDRWLESRRHLGAQR